MATQQQRGNIIGAIVFGGISYCIVKATLLWPSLMTPTYGGVMVPIAFFSGIACSVFIINLFRGE